MKFTLEIELDAKFSHPAIDIADMLNRLCHELREDGITPGAHDINTRPYWQQSADGESSELAARTVGKWEVTETTRMPEQTDRITCPRCASANVVVCPDWEARSLDPTDRENTATLTEYQCRACEGVSFWIGTEKPAETPAKPQASEPYRVERVRLFTDRVFGECAEILVGDPPEPGATNVRLAWGIYQRQPDGTDKHLADFGTSDEALVVAGLLNNRL